MEVPVDDERSILIVDDEGDFLALLGHILSETGLRILTANSGAEALGILEKNREYANGQRKHHSEATTINDYEPE